MPKRDSIDLLNQLLAVQFRSLAMYLANTWPGMRDPADPGAAVVSNIVADQQALCRRIAEMVRQRGGVIDTGEYPMDYTDTHDLASSAILRRLLEAAAADVAAVEAIVEALAGDSAARELAEEVLGSQRAHLEAIEQALAQPAAT